MSDGQKSVFISYRRETGSYIARAIFQQLRANNYDVFMDVESIDSGIFETIILNEIAARAHFLIILTKGTLTRCSNPEDWVRREIERAIDTGRNIVPIFVDDFNLAEEKNYLTGELQNLTRYNGLKLYRDYFKEGITRLQKRYLKTEVSVSASSVTYDRQAYEVIRQKIQEASSKAEPTKSELAAERFCEEGYAKYGQGDYRAAISDFDRAIELDPDYGFAYTLRGVCYLMQGQETDALEDFNKALEINPRDAHAFGNRGHVFYRRGDYKRALAEYDEAIKIDSAYYRAYYNRGLVRQLLGDVSGARSDFEAIVDNSKDTQITSEASKRLMELGSNSV